MVFGWAGTGAEFVAHDPAALLHKLSDAAERHYRQAPGHQQEAAWSHEVACLSTGLHLASEAAQWGVILEYELPFEGGRRPDVVLLAGDRVLVLEFKDTSAPGQADIDQARAYARDLAEYHSCCRDRAVAPLLVLPHTRGRRRVDDVELVDCLALSGALQEFAGGEPQPALSCLLDGMYSPLPSLVRAARLVWEREPLPFIRRAESAGIPDLLAWLHRLARDARARGERHLVLVTGVPGSGKTLVGLQFVYEVEPGDEPEAVFLSGNGPLVKVLQDALGGTKVFVRDWKAFDREVGAHGRLPAQHVLVFDEAQRAWDRERMREKHGIDKSEPELAIEALARLPDWGIVIALVGEGQEIYLGEEAGLGQWVEAVRSVGVPMNVHVPPHLDSTMAPVAPVLDRRLNLTLSLRTHRADNVEGWLAAFIDGRLDVAGRIAPSLRESGYDLYVTDDLRAAKEYLVRRYADAPDKRFGLLASSRAGNLPAVGVDNSFWSVERIRIGRWFNAPASDPESCCQLSKPITEFKCQGLELDLPIVCWGDDLAWDGGWVSRRPLRRARDSHQLRLNSYRVLLSRGRDGQIVYLPPNLPFGQSASLTQALFAAGARWLESNGGSPNEVDVARTDAV
ncbi:MAG TPA: DNA/RNA helicase domain-containing protein [Candidatus Limnocylindrales bacterium]